MAADINLTYKQYCADKSAESLEKLVVDGRGIVCHFASVYGGGCDRDDLFQSGMIGLLRAAKTFDPHCGAAFSTWAAHCVISEIRHFVRSERAFLCPGAGDDEKRGCENGSGESYTVILPLCDADGAQSRGAPNNEKQASFQLAVEDKLALEQAAASLGVMQRNVIDALYFRGMTQQQTADELGITQRRVSRLKCAAVSVLHELLDPASFHLVDSKYTFRNISNMKFKK